MRKYNPIIAIVFLLLAVHVSGSTVAPQVAASTAPIPIHISVDARVELISIIFRLAGNPEYQGGRVPSYIEDITQHFGPHSKHPVVMLARRLRRTYGVSYDAPMSLTAHISDATQLLERVPFDPHPPGLDRRWHLNDVREFLEQARDFVEVSDFNGFYAAHEPLYRQAEERMKKMVKKHAKLDWFRSFFGARPGADFKIALALVNGGCCYGSRIKLDDSEELYCILGVWKCDRNGIPVFKQSMLSTVAHEFCHSYANPIVDAHLDELRSAGENIFPRVKNKMKRMAYGSWQTMMKESLVRACVVRYIYATQGEWAAAKQAQSEKSQGFWWVPELSSLLAEYENSRDIYPTLETFAPKITAFFYTYSQNLSELEPQNAPKVTRMIPPNLAIDVDPDLGELRVTFNMKMGKGVAWCGGGPHFPEIPEGKSAYWSKDRKTCILPVKLKPNWTYRVYLNMGHYNSFRSAEGTPMPSLGYTFRTGKRQPAIKE
jgi:Domain of unknown function (DUF4932)